MIIIAHRGRSTPSDPENNIDHIQELHVKYPWMYFEIDLWYIDGTWLIGHDLDQAIPVDFQNIERFRRKLLIHAKNTAAYQQLYYAGFKLPPGQSQTLSSPDFGYNYFMHDADPIGVSTWGWVIANYEVYPQHPMSIIHPRSGKIFLSDLGPETYRGVMTDDPLIFYGYWAHRV